MHNKNIKFNKRKIPLIAGSLALGGMFLFPYLTLTPTPVYAAYDWETRTLSDISTMQDMNAKICENSEIGETKQLEDTREPGKKYWVTKLKGDAAGTKEKGECWMTQNLDYNIPSFSSTSPSGWNITDASYQAYYDPGEYIYNVGSSGQNGNCTSTNFTDCSVQFSAQTSSSNLHYHVGNYYSWTAAVANNTNATEPKQGVCPDHWHLPISNSANSKSFDGLISAYGITSSTLTTDGGSLYGNPLYFVYGGNIGQSKLGSAGSTGLYWYSTLDSTADYAARQFLFRNDLITSSNNNRYLGNSVRCVAADIYPEKPPITDNDTANVAITVSPVISIDVTKDANDMTVDFTKVATSTIVARVGSNQPYQVLLSTDKSNLTNPKTNQTIPMIPSDQTIVRGTNSWGIKKLSSPTDTEVNESTKYSPVGINGNKELFYTSTSAASEDLTFPVAIAVDSSLPSGQYSTQVTLTAVAM